MKILFLGESKEAAELFGRLCLKLEEKGVSSHFATSSLIVKEITKDLKITNVNYILKNFNYKLSNNNVFKNLKIFEDKYNISISRIIESDLEHQQIPINVVYTKILNYLLYWEKYIEKNKPDAIVGAIERIPSVTCQLIARSHNIPYYFMSSIPIKNRVIFNSTIMGKFRDMPDINKLKLTDQELERAKKYLDEERKVKFSHLVRQARPTINKQKIKFFINMCYLNYFIEKNKNPYIDIRRGIKSYVKRFFAAKRAKNLYSQKNHNDKIVFFPFHVPFDAAIFLRAPHLKDQEYVVRMIASSLPVGYTLYVKEHPCLPGAIPYKVQKSISKIPNVKLLNPNISSREIIKESKLIVTINSTVGWEALVHKKQVISLGIAYYDDTGLSYPLRDLYLLPSVIRERIQKTDFDEEKLLKFVHSLYEISYPGNTQLTNVFYSEKENNQEIYSENNIDILSDGLIKQMKKDEKRKMKENCEL